MSKYIDVGENQCSHCGRKEIEVWRGEKRGRVLEWNWGNQDKVII